MTPPSRTTSCGGARFAPYAFIERHNPFLANVRGEPGFRRLLEEARRRAESFEENPA